MYVRAICVIRVSLFALIEHRDVRFQGIPTLIIAVSGIDDAASVAIHGIVKSIMFSHDALWYQILQGPIAIVGGLGFGIMWGWLAKYVPEKGDVSIQSRAQTSLPNQRKKKKRKRKK